jgi:hypothetical protein
MQGFTVKAWPGQAALCTHAFLQFKQNMRWPLQL